MWIMENCPDAIKAMEEGNRLFGTVDTWLIWVRGRKGEREGEREEKREGRKREGGEGQRERERETERREKGAGGEQRNLGSKHYM